MTLDRVRLQKTSTQPEWVQRTLSASTNGALVRLPLTRACHAPVHAARQVGAMYGTFKGAQENFASRGALPSAADGLARLLTATPGPGLGRKFATSVVRSRGRPVNAAAELRASLRLLTSPRPQAKRTAGTSAGFCASRRRPRRRTLLTRSG